MKDAGILEGDLVVVEHHTPTKPGDIVVAWADNELTVKTLLLPPPEPLLPATGQLCLQAHLPGHVAGGDGCGHRSGPQNPTIAAVDQGVA